jgi:hypothetical protein
MTSISASQAIRDAFGLFWQKRSGRRLPEDLKGLSFTNVTTFSTRVRVRLLKEIGQKHQLANPNLSCFVTSYEPRPELKIRDRRGPLTSLNYIQAVQSLSHLLSPEFLSELTLFARTNLPETEVIERFLLLGPDCLGLAAQGQAQVQNSSPMSVQGTAPTLSTFDTAVVAHPFQPTIPPPPLSRAPQVPLPGTSHSQSFNPVSSSQHSMLLQLSPPPATFPSSQNSQPFGLGTQVASAPTVPSVSGPLLDDPNQTPSLSDNDPLQKRNRSRFAPRSTPYPLS